MIDAFEKESKLHERRIERQRQMRLMEEAATGLPSDVDDPPQSQHDSTTNQLDSSNNTDDFGYDGLGNNAPPTMADIENNRTTLSSDYLIDEYTDDEDNAGPPSVFTDTASSHLWSSKTPNSMKLDAEKLGFITGGGGGESDSNSSAATPRVRGKGGWLKKKVKKKNKKQQQQRVQRSNKNVDESRELILMASRRLSEGISSSFNISKNGRSHANNDEYDEEEDDFRQRNYGEEGDIITLHYPHGV